MVDQSIQEVEKQKKRYLKRYRKNRACIYRLEAKLSNLEDRLTAIRTPNLTGMPRGGTPVAKEDLISDKIDLEERIKRLKVKSRDLKRAVWSEIDKLEDPRYCDVLEAYFIDCLSFEEIADELGYTERHVYTLYGEAISFLANADQ
jgi:DNA-directed RNA polymerase specialized sigma24 family protein